MAQKIKVRPITPPDEALKEIRKSLNILIIGYIPKSNTSKRFQKIREQMDSSKKRFKVYAPLSVPARIREFFPNAILGDPDEERTGETLNCLSLSFNREVAERGVPVDVNWIFTPIFNTAFYSKKRMNVVLLTDDKHLIGDIFGGQLTSPVAEALNAFDEKKLKYLKMGDVPKSHYLDFEKEQFFTF